MVALSTSTSLYRESSISYEPHLPGSHTSSTISSTSTASHLSSPIGKYTPAHSLTRFSQHQQVHTISTGSPRSNILVKTIAQVTLAFPAARCALSDFQVANHCAAVQATLGCSLPSPSIPVLAIADLIQHLNTHIATAKALDEEHHLWMANCWPSWRYKSIKLAAAASDSPATSSSSDDLDEPFSSSQEQPARTASYYTDIFIAGSWNTYRAYRILLRGTMKLCHDRIAALENLVSAAAPPPATVFNKLKASTPPPDVLSSYSIESPAAMAALPNVTVTSPEDVTESTSFCKDMIDDILASVPFCLGDIDSSGRIATRARPRAAGGYGLLFPLGIVSRSPFASKAQKSGVKAALERIGGQMSIRRARMQAEGVFGGRMEGHRFFGSMFPVVCNSPRPWVCGIFGGIWQGTWGFLCAPTPEFLSDRVTNVGNGTPLGSNQTTSARNQLIISTSTREPCAAISSLAHAPQRSEGLRGDFLGILQATRLIGASNALPQRSNDNGPRHLSRGSL